MEQLNDQNNNSSEETRIIVNTSPDLLKAYVRLRNIENSNMPFTKDEIITTLKSKGISFGINEEAIMELVSSPVFDCNILVAEGQNPTNGANGKVIYEIDISKNNAPTITADGKVDYRELNLIKNVTAQTVLCRLEPPVMGIDGLNVKGERIKCINGKSAALPRGKNVHPSEDGQSLIAAIDGQVDFQDDGTLNVFATYEVKDDVDNSVGNICFIGNVVIRGNVLSGFSIEAKGNVEVWGVVEAATIIAKGKIILRKGISGLGKGRLESESDIVAKYIESSIVTAKGNIDSEAIMHSTVRCGGNLVVSGRKGLLVGGTTRVGREVTARVIGSPMAIATEIEAGLDPAVRERYKAIKEEMTQIESDIKKAEQAVTLLKKLEQAASLSEDKKELLVKSTRTKIFLSSRYMELENEKTSLDEILQENFPSKIKASDYIYPGTRVAIGSSMMYVKEVLQNCTLYRDGADIRVGPGERY